MTWATQNDQLQNVKKVIWRNLAKVRLALKKYDRALVASNNFLKVEDQPYRRADGMLDKASILLGLGKYAEARKTAEEALALGVEGPLMASLKIVLGDISYAEKKFDEAAKHYGVTAELFVNDAELKPKALFKAAEALDKAGPQVGGFPVPRPPAEGIPGLEAGRGVTAAGCPLDVWNDWKRNGEQAEKMV